VCRPSSRVASCRRRDQYSRRQMCAREGIRVASSHGCAQDRHQAACETGATRGLLGAGGVALVRYGAGVTVNGGASSDTGQAGVGGNVPPVDRPYLLADDHPVKRQWLARAAEAGNVPAASYLANLLDNEDPAAAEFWDDRASQLLDEYADYPVTLTEAWDDIEMHLLQCAPRLAVELAPPATDAEITAAQERLGLTFPPELVESLHRHNGGGNAAIFSHKYLLSVAEIVEKHEFLMEVTAQTTGFETAPDDTEPYWHELWLPFASADSDSLVIDLRPASYGRIGRHWHDAGASYGDGPLAGLHTYWSSLREFLATVAPDITGS
jgi:cell wall assembly regulator SMI1